MVIFRHSLEVSDRIFIRFSKEIFTSSVLLAIYCLIRIWIGSVRSAFLNFKCESVSQQNCRANFDNLLLPFGVCVSSPISLAGVKIEPWHEGTMIR